MNKIVVNNNEILEQDINNNILVEFDKQDGEFAVSTLKIIVTENSRLELFFKDSSNSKMDVFITVLEDKIFDFFELKTSGDYKTRYKYFVEENASLNITKFYDVNILKEMNMIYLNGNNAEVNYLHKTISKTDQQVDVVVSHKYNNTKSNIINHGINIMDGRLNFNVTSTVPIEVKDCHALQFSRIINQTENRCLIMPNLLIEGNTALAEHSAYIGGFKPSELFYMLSRGINEESAKALLIHGFMLDKIEVKDGLKNELSKIIKRYWK